MIETSVIEMFGGMVGGIGLFIVGMQLLTENLKALASRRLRVIAQSWTENRLSSFAMGTIAGGVTQSTSAVTFVVVSVLRSGLVTTSGAFAIIMGANLGATLLVLMVTFDIKLISLFVLGIAGVVMISERAAGYRPIAASFFGGAMMILGLILLKDSAAPMTEQSWFGEMVEWTGTSLLLAFLVAATLTAIVQSSSAVCVFGITLASLGVIGTDQAIMFIYGSCLGASVITYVLSASLTGRSRQVAMYQVTYNVLLCAVLVPLLYVELYFNVPLMKALVLSFEVDLDQQLAFVFIFLVLFTAPFMLAVIGPSSRIFERLWPATAAEDLSRTKFIHGHAFADVETALVLVDLEQRRVLGILPRYFDAVRRGRRQEPLREATGHILSEIDDFLAILAARHPMRNAERHSAMLTRQILVSWLEGQVAALCEALLELDDKTASGALRTSICEGVHAVFLSLLEAIDTGDEDFWAFAKTLTGGRSALMRKMRDDYLDAEPPFDDAQRGQIIAITNTVEQVFFLLSKLVQEFDDTPNVSTRVLERRHAV